MYVCPRTFKGAEKEIGEEGTTPTSVLSLFHCFILMEPNRKLSLPQARPWQFQGFP